mmetsp:Transcript_104614/g.234892  ORF Transcript_104614/g.234892 Transcript_104614/m.234892 type:complete len:348 (-) Transcript_104614:147-1190(-)
MGASACTPNKDGTGGDPSCCNAQKWAGTDMVPEYQPRGKHEVHRECMEPAPPMALALRQNGEKPGNEEGCSESYFARELQELKKLSGWNRNNGPRPLYTFKTGATYLGQWKGNARHGVGEQIWADGARFCGTWNESFAEGLGKFTHADGDVFVGQWKHNAAQGLGTYYHKRGLTTYGGQWVEDYQHGHGVEVWEGGSKYNGQFVWGKKQGYGVYLWPDGSQYSGQWNANSINGYGHYIGKDGREFKGMWRDAVIHGCGKYSWPDGRTFCGQYADDQKQGFGIFTWKDGRRFEGFWHQGKQHGWGVTYKPNGEVLKMGMWNMGHQPETPEDVPEMSRHSRDRHGKGDY